MSGHPTFWPRLLAAKDEAPGARTFRFASPPGFRFTPGQFLMFHFADDPKTWRAYSACSSPAAAGNTSRSRWAWSARSPTGSAR
ncbi:MAG: hypothetical protein M0D55_11990 [Elusimicrobiota bacterium]|nr:MAG: hypothetical protein M0D55_11990 [Elusimicrobiota bacterium]